MSKVIGVDAPGESIDCEGSMDFTALAQHSSSYVRASLASNPETPQDVIRQLAKDENSSVQLAAALNPSCPVDVLESLSRDPDWNVRLALANQLDVCEDILLALVDHKNPYLAAQSRYALAALEFEKKLKELAPVLAPGADYKLGELLVASKQISQDDLSSAIEAGRTFQLRLGRVLLQAGVVRSAVIIEALRLQSSLREKTNSAG
jgi:hypothetical protein